MHLSSVCSSVMACGILIFAASNSATCTAVEAQLPITFCHQPGQLRFGSLPQILHAYMAEAYAPWSGLKRGSAAYESLKDEKAVVLWGLIEQVGKPPWECTRPWYAHCKGGCMCCASCRR